MDTTIMNATSAGTIIRHSETAMESGEIANLFMAGHQVKSGLYRHLESGRVVQLEAGDYLPASLDGRVACYVRVADNRMQTLIAANLNTASADEPFELKKEKDIHA